MVPVRLPFPSRPFDMNSWRALPLGLARWLLVAIVLGVAWRFGLVVPADQDLFLLASACCGGLAVGGWALVRRWPWLPPAILRLGSGLLVFGWLIYTVPRAEYVSDLRMLIPLPRRVPDWFGGTVDARSTLRKMMLISAFLVLFVVAADAAASAVWRRRLAGSMALAAGLAAAFGLYQKAAGAPNIYWRPGPPGNPTFFGPFVYHGNAASFMLAGLPFSFGLALFWLRHPGHGFRKLTWSLCGLATVTGLLINTSRAGVWMGGMVLGVLTVTWLMRFWRGSDTGFRSRILLTGAVALGAIVLLGTAFGWEKALRRASFENVGTGLADRMFAPRLALSAVGDAGWSGFGPGTFMLVFPDYHPPTDLTRPAPVWENLHNDPLQTVLEWGWLGAAGWAGLLVLVARQGARRVRATAPDSGTRLLLEAAGLSFGVLFLHSMVDFPFQIPAIATVMAVVAGLLASRPIDQP